MINAWSLLYEELNGTMDETYPIKEDKMTSKKEDDVITFSSDVSFEAAADTVSFDNSWWEDDGFSVTGNPTASSDTINITGSRLKGGMGNDHISFDVGAANTAYDDPKYYAGPMDFGDPYPTGGSVAATPSYSKHAKPVPDLKYKSQKYQENKGIKDLKDYVSSTYQGHYTNENSDVQTLDLIHSVGDAESFCRSNALKYLSRYDKKGSAKRDILKAMHYCLLLYYFSGNTNDETPTRGYETF